MNNQVLSAVIWIAAACVLVLYLMRRTARKKRR